MLFFDCRNQTTILNLVLAFLPKPTSQGLHFQSISSASFVVVNVGSPRFSDFTHGSHVLLLSTNFSFVHVCKQMSIVRAFHARERHSHVGTFSHPFSNETSAILAQAILAQAISSQAFHCSRVEVRLLCFLLLLVRRRSMPRRGWLPASDGWVQILHGPHPPSENWPGALHHLPGRQSKPVHAPEGGVNHKEVGSVCHKRSQRKQPENVPKGSRLHWELGLDNRPKSRC